VPSIGQECQGVCPNAVKSLRENVDDIQRDTDRKRPAKIGWRMPVIMMTMSMGLFLIIIVVLVMMMAMIGLTGGLVP
jgi:hypothetical protein